MENYILILIVLVMNRYQFFYHVIFDPMSHRATNIKREDWKINLSLPRQLLLILYPFIIYLIDPESRNREHYNIYLYLLCIISC